jgi:hypothetical protein
MPKAGFGLIVELRLAAHHAGRANAAYPIRKRLFAGTRITPA